MESPFNSVSSFNFASSFTFFSVITIGVIEHSVEMRRIIHYIPILKNIRYISIPTQSILLFLVSYYYHQRSQTHYIV